VVEFRARRHVDAEPEVRRRSEDPLRAGVNPPAGATDPFEALGDPTRRRILELLGREPQSVAVLADQLPVSRPAVSRHLRLLKEAGFVEEVPDGTRRVYHVRDDGLETIRAGLEQIWGEAAARLRLVAENTEPRGPA
jgi:DNA-binding transcriptional ArsR family regulator